MQKHLEADLPISPDDVTFARLLVPVDFGAGSRRALGAALTLRRALGSEVHLFNLTEYGANDEFLAGAGGRSRTPGDLVDEAKDRLRRFVDNIFPGRAGDVRVHARMGADVVHGIERIATDVKATLVILSGHPKESLFRTDIERIVRKLDGGVLLLRSRDEVRTS